eukprot:401087-Rhodomonas_salina.1
MAAPLQMGPFARSRHRDRLALGAVLVVVPVVVAVVVATPAAYHKLLAQPSVQSRSSFAIEPTVYALTCTLSAEPQRRSETSPGAGCNPAANSRYRKKYEPRWPSPRPAMGWSSATTPQQAASTAGALKQSGYSPTSSFYTGWGSPATPSEATSSTTTTTWSSPATPAEATSSATD